LIEIFARAAAYASIQPVERAVLEDLVKIGITALSGTNSQSYLPSAEQNIP
jgi:hypothetical protein